MRRFQLSVLALALAILYLSRLPNSLLACEPKVTSLRVAIYSFLPEANTAVEQLKEQFEKDNSSIDIDFEL